MTEDATDVAGGFRLRNVEDDQAVALMTKPSVIEVTVVREEGRAAEPKQKRDDVLVCECLLREAVSDLAHRDSPGAQHLTLICPDVLVKDVHAGADS